MTTENQATDIQSTDEQRTEGQPLRRHRRREAASDQLLGLRNVLNIIFMLLAIVGVCIYVWGDSTIGTYIIIGGMAFKMVECSLRMLK